MVIQNRNQTQSQIQNEILRDYLKKNGLKITAQRETVLNYLLRVGKHMGPDDIYNSLRQTDPRLGRATVFRTLKLLERCGLASHVTSADGRHKFEAKYGRPHHDHMICVDCGETLEFTNNFIEQLQEKVARKHHFEILIKYNSLGFFGRFRSRVK